MAEEQKPEIKKKRKYVEGYTDIAKSIVRGGPNFVKGASEFVLGPIDYVFDSDFQTKFNKMMNTKEVLGEAETLPGALTELSSTSSITVTFFLVISSIVSPISLICTFERA